MHARPRSLLVALSVGALTLGSGALAGCGGGDDTPEWVQELESERPRTQIGGTSTTSASDVAAPDTPPETEPVDDEPPVDDGPPVEVFPIDPRGDDFDRIWRELAAFELWLLSNPDPRLASMVYVEGSDLHSSAVELLTSARTQGTVVRLEGSRVVSVELTDRPDDRTAEIRYVDTRSARVELDAATGEEIDREDYPPRTWVWDAVLEADDTGRWHMAAIEFVDYGPPFDG